MSIVNELEEYMKKKKLKLPQVATATGIPYDRMYKWTKGIGFPKSEDTQKIRDFISGKISNMVEEPETIYIKKQSEGELGEMLKRFMDMLSSQQKIIETHAVTIERHSATIHDQQATIHQLVTNKKTA